MLKISSNFKYSRRFFYNSTINIAISIISFVVFYKFVQKSYYHSVKDSKEEVVMNGKDKGQELDQLKAENEHLRAKLQEATKQKKKHFHINGRTITRRISLLLAGGLFVIASIIFYIGLTLIDTDRFMNVAGPLIQQPAIQSAVTQKTTDALFEKVDVEQLALDVLPDRIDFLAPEVAKQVQNFTKNEVQKILASDRFQQVWETSLSTAHERFITALENYEGDGTISITDVYNRLSERLDDTKLSFLANKTLPAKIGNITVVQADWLPTAHRIVSNIDTIRIITIGLFFGLLAVAVWLSNNRRRTLISIGYIVSGLSLLMLIFIRIARNAAVGQVDPQYQAAATEAWVLLAKPFALQLVSTILFGLAIVAVAWLGGKSKSALAVRNRADALFSGRLHQSIFNKGENKFSIWVGKHQTALYITVAVLFVLSFLYIPLSFGSILSAILLALVAVAIVQAIAAPTIKKPNTPKGSPKSTS